MTDSPEFDFIQSVHAQWHVISTDVQFKWMAQWTDLHNLSHGAGCRNPVFHAYDHITCPKALTDLFTMSKFMGKEVLNLQRLSCTGIAW